VVVGEGPECANLKAEAGANVEFTGRVAPERLREWLQGARAFMFAAVEDFGIAPVEAMACGTPVIALRRGGAAETVAGLSSGAPTGVFFEEQSVAAVVAAVHSFEENAARVTAQACRARAEQFSAARFRAEFMDFVRRKWAEWKRPDPEGRARAAR
jgi:glycosyltransferase involved in cell wall biosynthesis